MLGKHSHRVKQGGCKKSVRGLFALENQKASFLIFSELHVLVVHEIRRTIYGAAGQCPVINPRPGTVVVANGHRHRWYLREPPDAVA